MKKILLAVSMMFALTACIYEEMPQAPKVDNDADVVLDFSIVVPEAQAVTKTLDDPAVTSLTVVVFDENGFFVAAREATQIGGASLETTNVSNVSSNDAVSFEVALPQSTSPRKLHFVANKAATDFSYGMETDVMTSLVTDGRADAYWQKVEVKSLLSQDVESYLSPALSNIPMVRNYAKIVVKNSAANFTLTGFRVLNAPTSGTVVPYNVNSENFQLYWKASGDKKVGRNYTELNGELYHGFMPAGFNENTGVADLPAGDWATVPVYTYERIYDESAQKPLSILIKGVFDDDDDKASYYKIDLYNSTNGNFDVLRNIEYTVTITDVLGDGYTTEADAAENTAGNNISNSTSTNSLLNISDGNCRLFVEYVSKRVLSDDDDFYLKYKFIPDIKSPTTYNNSIANAYGTTDTPDNDNPLTITCVKPEGSEGEVITKWEYDSAYGVDDEGWSRIKLTPKTGFDGQNWMENLVFTSTYAVSEDQTVILNRTVSLYRVDKYALQASCTESVYNVIGAKATVNAILPVDLPQDIFPLVLDIETAASSLYPEPGSVNILNQTINMPVVSGPSLNSANKNNAFHFERTLTWEEYSALKTAGSTTVSVPSYFLTNKEASATTVYVYNEYFNLATCSFTNTTAPDQIIPAGQITFNLHDSTSRNVSVYLNPEYSDALITINNVSDNSTYGSDLNLGKVSDNQIVYFRYAATRYNIMTTYYTASATVAQLKAGVTLNFTAQ